jgi:hypothetical protein
MYTICFESYTFKGAAIVLLIVAAPLSALDALLLDQV